VLVIPDMLWWLSAAFPAPKRMDSKPHQILGSGNWCALLHFKHRLHKLRNSNKGGLGLLVLGRRIRLHNLYKYRLVACRCKGVLTNWA